jgi:hypothetical protein
MALILRQALLLIAAVAGAYALFLVCGLLIMRPETNDARLNTANAGDSLYMTQPKYVFMSRTRLNTETDKLLLVGASNTMAGFRQEQVQALLPAMEVHNLSVGGSNMTQLAQIVELVREAQSPAARRHDLYVFGLWYGVFASNAARWHSADRVEGDTDMDIERYRYGFYRRSPQGPVPVLPTRLLDAGAVLVHPFLVLDSLARDATRGMRRFFDAKPKPLSDEDRNATIVGPARQAQYLAFWREYTGQARTLEPAQFEALTRTVDAIVADGGHVLLVDLPIPPWHTAGSVLAADYRQQLDRLLPQLRAKPGVQVLDMTGAAADDDFNDEVHPKPRVTSLWAQRLATAVMPQASPPMANQPAPVAGARL